MNLDALLSFSINYFQI